MKCIGLAKKAGFFLVYLFLASTAAFTQNQDSSKQVLNFSGTASLTNNGFSFIPSFSLGKPAAIFNFNVNGGKRLSFEPEFRFALEGAKPWSFIFIWRYKLINGDKFKLSVGTHLPAIAFRTVPVTKNGQALDVIQAQRFLPVLELNPHYWISKNTSLGFFYLYGHSPEVDATQNTHFVSFRANFANIKLGEQISLRLNPQVFYLKIDAKDGFYTAANLTLSKKKFPLSISAMINQAIETDIAGKNLNWNLSLSYSFSSQFKR